MRLHTQDLGILYISLHFDYLDSFVMRLASLTVSEFSVWMCGCVDVWGCVWPDTEFTLDLRLSNSTL